MKFPEADTVWPNIEAVAAPFYEGMALQRVMIQQCETCSTYLPPAQVVCDHCGGDTLNWIEVSGLGKIYSYVVYHRSFHPAFNEQVPYTVALIELNEGPRLQAQFINGEEHCYVGMPVEPTYKIINDEHTLLCYKCLED